MPKFNIIFNNKNYKIRSNTYILLLHDSICNLSYLNNNSIIKKYINTIEILEKKIKEKISFYKFKTLHNRNHLPLGTSIHIVYNNLKIIYSPKMWIKQDISNTNNTYWSVLSGLTLIYKNCKSKDNIDILILDDNTVDSSDQYIKAYNDFNKNIANNNYLDKYYHSDDNNIHIGEFSINEQPPLLQNNEFRELSN